jgi:allene oxide cyclase
MKRLVIFTSVVTLLVGLLVGFVIANLTSGLVAHASSAGKIHVIEHALTDTVQEFHPGKMSLGDVLGFHNPVFDAANKHQVGKDNGQCTRTVATGKTEWECFWTTFLAGGQITVEGPYYDDGTDTTLTITGGTGAYAGANGSMLLHLRNPGAAVSQFDFIFSLGG